MEINPERWGAFIFPNRWNNKVKEDEKQASKVPSIQRDIKSDLSNLIYHLAMLRESNKNNCKCCRNWLSRISDQIKHNGFGASVLPRHTDSKSLRMQKQFCQASKANKRRSYQVSDSSRFVLVASIRKEPWMKRRRLRELGLELIAKTW